MPDVSQDIREVYEMVTKQKPPDTGALERQRTRQIRTMRNRKIGAFAVAAAIVVAAVAVILATRPGEKATKTGGDPRTNPVEVATSFVEAYGAFDVEKTMSYLADDANVAPLIEWVGAQGGEGPLEGFRLLFSLLQAQGYEQTLDSCEELGRSASVTSLHCTFDFHSLRSDEIGRGPYSGSYFDLIVRDGEIVHASNYLEIERFSPQMWEPFARWVSRTYPEDAAVMYRDETHSLERLTEESIRLWERHTKEYVREVKQSGTGE
jgi:hypothetical protein